MNGVAQTGVNCAVNGASKCLVCNVGFTINHGKTQCIRTWLCYVHTSVSSRVRSVFDMAKQQQTKVDIVRSVCYHEPVANVCTCENGVAPLGVNCPVNGAAKCVLCNSGWTISDDHTKCNCTFAHSRINQQTISRPYLNRLAFSLLAVNTCICKNGLPQTGVHCPVNGAAKCASCNVGFTFNQAKTECIRTFSHFRGQKKSTRPL